MSLSPSRRRALRAGFLFVPLTVALLAAACVPQTILPADCDAPSVTRQATLVGERLSPEQTDICRGQGVQFEITVDAAGVLHLHGYDDEAPAQAVEAGQTVTLAFAATRAGQFHIEFHGATADMEIGILTVHER
ncbi:MAG: hypothetical protein OEW24_07350 [Chloroflexota bacterium]|nr:hypothetical protein [Chloroflexota bacterium]